MLHLLKGEQIGCYFLNKGRVNDLCANLFLSLSQE